MKIHTMTAAQVMSPNVITIGSSEPLRKAARLMNEHHVHCLIVPSVEPNRIAGVIAVKDIVQILCDGEEHLLDELRVDDAATAPAVTVQKDFVIIDCIRIMRMAGVRSVPVLDGLRPVGVLSFTDIVRSVGGGKAGA